MAERYELIGVFAAAWQEDWADLDRRLDALDDETLAHAWSAAVDIANTADGILAVRRRGEGFVTATGKVVTEEDIARYVEEAERGYDFGSPER